MVAEEVAAKFPAAGSAGGSVGGSADEQTIKSVLVEELEKNRKNITNEIRYAATHLGGSSSRGGASSGANNPYQVVAASSSRGGASASNNPYQVAVASSSRGSGNPFQIVEYQQQVQGRNEPQQVQGLGTLGACPVFFYKTAMPHRFLCAVCGRDNFWDASELHDHRSTKGHKPKENWFNSLMIDDPERQKIVGLALPPAW